MDDKMVQQILQTVKAINLSVTGTSVDGSGSQDDVKEDPQIPYDQARGLATQNIAQSAALAVADGVDMMRNVETIMTTAMGVAMAQWIANPANVLYEQIIQQASTQIAQAATNFTKIATAASGALADFKPSA
jgi:hypothetical protein